MHAHTHTHTPIYIYISIYLPLSFVTTFIFFCLLFSICPFLPLSSYYSFISSSNECISPMMIAIFF